MRRALSTGCGLFVDVDNVYSGCACVHRIHLQRTLFEHPSRVYTNLVVNESTKSGCRTASPLGECGGNIMVLPGLPELPNAFLITAAKRFLYAPVVFGPCDSSSGGFFQAQSFITYYSER